MRAERTGAVHDELYLASETDLATIVGQIDAVDPQLVIVDSVQTVSSSNGEGLAGGPSQVREVASTLIRVAKDRDLPILHRRARHERRLDRRPATARAPGGCGLPVRGRPADRAPLRARAQEPLRADRRGRLLRDDRRRHRRGRRPERAVPQPHAPRPCPARASPSRWKAAGRSRSRCRRSSSARPRPTRAGSPTASTRPASPCCSRCSSAARASSSATKTSTSRRSAACASPSPAPTSRSPSPSRRRRTSGPIPHTLAAFGEISLAGEIRPVVSGKQRTAEAARLGFTTRVDDRSASIREACALAFAAGTTERERELDAAF